MANKGRKTKKEKMAGKSHQFSPWITRAPTTINTKSGEIIVEKSKQEIPKYVYDDLKKITFIMACFVVAVVALALISYNTNLLNSFFVIFHIKY